MEEAMRSTQFQIKTLQGQYKTTEVRLLRSPAPPPSSCLLHHAGQKITHVFASLTPHV